MEGFLKFAVKFPKSNVSFPLGWTSFTSEECIPTDFKYTNQPNFAVPTGQINNIIVVDLDNKTDDQHTSFLAHEWFIEHFGSINTFATTSPNGGYHIFFEYTPLIAKSLSSAELHIDIQSNKKCVYQGKGYNVICTDPIRKLTDNEIEFILSLSLKNEKTTSLSTDTVSSSRDDLPVLVDRLGDHRAVGYYSWLFVGMALKNADSGPRGLQLFDTFSKRCPEKYNATSVEKNWNNFSKSGGLTIGSLYYWANQDTGYKKETSTALVPNIDIKELVNEIYKEKYKEGKLVDTKHDNKNKMIVSKIVENATLDVQHYKQEKCNKVLFFGMSLPIKGVEGELNANVYCLKCEYRHENPCVTNTIIYNIIAPKEKINELVLHVPIHQQLCIHPNPKINNLLYKSLNQDDSCIHNILYEMCNDTFMIVKKKWYNYTGVLWIKDINTHPTGLLKAVYEIKDYIANIAVLHETEQNLNTDLLKKLQKIVINITTKMGSDFNCLNKVGASEWLFRKEIEFDMQKNLLAFENGVFDLNTYEFRDGYTIEIYVYNPQ